MSDEWKTPSPRLWLARLTLAGGVGAMAVIAAAVIGGVSGGGAAAGGAGGGVLVLVLVLLASLRGRYRSWGWAEREEDLLVRRGVLVRRLSVVPYGRMQFVDVTAGPVDRLFGLSTVQLHTAAARTDARIPGLPTEEANRLRDTLSRLGESQAAGL